MSLIGIFTTDTGLVVKTWDSALVRMTGIPAECAVGRRLDDIVPTLRGDTLVDFIREPLVSGSAQVLAPALHKFLIPCPPLTPSREFEQMQQRVVAGALRDDQHTVGLVVTIEDVTERLERERQLARELREATPAMRMKAVERFSSTHTDGLGPLADAMADEDWRVRRAAVRALSARRDASLVDALVSALRDGHRNFGLLSSALQLLTLTGVDSTDALIALMNDPDVDLRIQAALALGTQREPSAVDSLIRALDDPDANVRFHAIESLGRLAATRAIPHLATIAESGNVYLAFPAVEALVRINDPSVAPRLAPLLRDPILGASAAAALGQIGDEEWVDALVDALGAPETSAFALCEALVQIHRRYQTSFGGGEEIEDLVRRRLSPAGLERLLDALDRTSGEGVRTFAMVLGWLRDPAIPPALARLLGSVEARHDVIEAFVRCGSSAVSLLVEQLADEDREIQRSAVVALGRIGDRRAVPALLTLVDDPSRELWIPVISALAKIGDPRAFEPLIQLLGDSDVAARQAAVGALNSIGHPEMAGRVRVLLGDPSPLVRESALKIAGYFGYPECVDAVLKCCGDPDESVRSAALEHLPYFDDPRAGDLLDHALASEAPRARAAAAKALGALPGPAAVESLHAALLDQEPWVRYFAAISLGRHGDAATLQQLARRAAGDPAPHVRVAAVEAIGAIGGELAIDILKPLAEKDDGDSSLAALRVMGQSQSDAIGSTLHEAARASDVNRRLAAVEALSYWGHEQAVESLQWAAAADSDSAVSAAALDGLGAIANRNCAGSRAAVRAALKVVSDPARRDLAVAVLGRLTSSAIPYVAESLNADDPHIRHAVVEVLGRLTHPAASACLRKALEDTDATVRRDAVRALSRLGTRGLARRLSTMAEKDHSPDVRRAAAAALSRQGDSPEGRE